jgi:acyl-coenzyme A synthetase/AMP-(fatty) acid ligase/acyl carrier protein
MSVYAHWRVDEALRDEFPRPPVGRTVPGFSVTIVDEHGRAVPDGETGEITVSSRYVALGYWNEPDLTARTFTVDPSNTDVRTVRTGDLGRLRSDGLLEFLGRADSQIKLHGHRIETGEVESALRGCAGVRDAAVVVRRSEDGVPRALVAYCELTSETNGPLPRHLRSMLRQALPVFMVPAEVLVLEELPRLPNLKVDRVMLAELDVAGTRQRSNRSDDPLIDEVALIFERILEISGATPEDNLPSLGGDSLQAVLVAAELEARFGFAIPLEIFETRRSIRGLASWIAAEQHPSVQGSPD